MAVTLSLSIVQNSQNITDNTSNVTVSATVKWTYGSYNATGKCTGSITIDGTKYSFSGLSFNTGQSTSGSQVVMTKTVNVPHNTNGSKTLSCSASFVTGVGSGTITASASKVLTTIPRKSTLSVKDGTLGTAQTLTVTKQSDDFTHTITYACGNASGTICTKSTAKSISFTPPVSLASQNTKGTSVSVTYTITTYNGNTSLGSNSYTKTCGIPASVKPTVSIAVDDPTGHLSTFGAYVQSYSKFQIDITASGSYGSTITNYTTTADGKTYTTASITTAVIKNSGSLTISTTVRDSRGRTASASITVPVLAYTLPNLTDLSVKRCNSDGSSSSSGEYLGITFSSVVTSLNSKNTAKYTIQYKKTTETSYSPPEELTDYSGQYSVANGVFVFPANKLSSYNITLTVTDSFESSFKTAVGSSVFKTWSMFKKGLGFAFGKIAELSGVLDIGFQTRFMGGILQPILEKNTDFDDVMTPNTYTLKNTSDAGYSNCPLLSGTGTLKIETCGEEGQLHQIVTVCSKTNPISYERFYYQGEWGEWLNISNVDSGWQNCTLQSGFARYSDASAPLQVRRIGKVVHLRGVVKPTTAVTPTSDTSTIIAKFDSAYAPEYSETIVCQGSSANRFLLTINSNGNIYISRYSDSATTNKEIPSGSWLNCYATWFLG